MQGTLKYIDNGWVIQYNYKHPHAGISKKGTGPGVSMPYTDKRIVFLHPYDIKKLQPEDSGRSVEFDIHNAPDIFCIAHLIKFIDNENLPKE